MYSQQAKLSFSLWRLYTQFINTGVGEEGKSDTAIKTQYKTPKSKEEIICAIISAKGILTQNITTDY